MNTLGKYIGLEGPKKAGAGGKIRAIYSSESDRELKLAQELKL
jgi:hypothetical protein